MGPTPPMPGKPEGSGEVPSLPPSMPKKVSRMERVTGIRKTNRGHPPIGCASNTSEPMGLLMQAAQISLDRPLPMQLLDRWNV
jgi:hypothetical protein